MSAQRRRCPRRHQQPVHPSVTQDVHVLDAVGPGDHPRDQGADLDVRVRTGRARDPDVLGDKITQAGSLGQGHDRDQPGTRHEVRIYRMLLLLSRMEPSQVPFSLVTGASVCHDPPWRPTPPADPGSVGLDGDELHERGDHLVAFTVAGLGDARWPCRASPHIPPGVGPVNHRKRRLRGQRELDDCWS